MAAYTQEPRPARHRTVALFNEVTGALFQREQALGPRLSTSDAFDVIPTHRQTAPGATPTFFLVFEPFLKAHITDLGKVFHIFSTVKQSRIDHGRHTMAGQLLAVSAVAAIQLFFRAIPYGAVLTMSRNLSATETTIAEQTFHPVRVRNCFVFAGLS